MPSFYRLARQLGAAPRVLLLRLRSLVLLVGYMTYLTVLAGLRRVGLVRFAPIVQPAPTAKPLRCLGPRGETGDGTFYLT